MGKYATEVKNGWLDSLTSSTLYLGLFVGDPNGAGVELSGSNYARQAVASTDWSVAASAFKHNVNPITFPKSTGIWTEDDMTHWALFDAAAAGNLKNSDDLPASQQQPVMENNTIEFSAGDLGLSISDPA